MRVFKKVLIAVSVLALFLLSTNGIRAWTESDPPVISTIINGRSLDRIDYALEVAVDKYDNVYVSEYGIGILKFDSNGNSLGRVIGWGLNDGEVRDAYGMCVDDLGNIYVTNRDAGTIQKFDNSGNLLLKFGGAGTGIGLFRQAGDVSVDSVGNIYVPDAMNNRIQKFDSNGHFLMKLDGGSFFGGAYGVSVDAIGNIYVPDLFGNQVQKFDSNGNHLLTIGSSGSGDGQLSMPYKARLDSVGNIYVTDTGNGRIQKFNKDGNYVMQFDNGGQISGPKSVSIDSKGNIYVVAGDSVEPDFVRKFDSSGNLLGRVGNKISSDVGQFYSPSSVVIDDQSNIYITDMGNDRVQKFDKTGAFLMQFGSKGANEGQFSGPSGISLDSNGNIYVVDSDNYRVQKFDSNGNFLMKFGSSGSANGQFNGASGIVLDTLGNIYVVDTWNHRVQKFDSNGTFLMTFGSNGTLNGQFKNPIGISLDSTDNIYVTDSGNNRVQKFNKDGTFLMRFGNAGANDGQFSGPSGISLDSNGNIYVVDSRNHRVQVFSNDGIYLKKFGTIGVGEEQFADLGGIDLDGEGQIYIVDPALMRVQRAVYDRVSPTVTITPFANNVTKSVMPTVTGRAIDNAGKITKVEYQMGGTAGIWSNCTAKDGVFNSIDEEFACNVTTSLSAGTYTIYVRSEDSRTNISVPSSYTFTVSPQVAQEPVSTPRIESIGLIGNIPNTANLFYYFTSQNVLIKGRGVPNSIVSFLNLDKVYQTTVDATGKFVLTIGLLPREKVILNYYSQIGDTRSEMRTLTLVIGEENFPQSVLDMLYGRSAIQAPQQPSLTTKDTDSTTGNTGTPLTEPKQTDSSTMDNLVKYVVLDKNGKSVGNVKVYVGDQE